eukprot:scaffold14008_cov119-Isochrysis_galbana.AAC.1
MHTHSLPAHRPRPGRWPLTSERIHNCLAVRVPTVRPHRLGRLDLLPLPRPTNLRVPSFPPGKHSVGAWVRVQHEQPLLRGVRVIKRHLEEVAGDGLRRRHPRPLPKPEGLVQRVCAAVVRLDVQEELGGAALADAAASGLRAHAHVGHVPDALASRRRAAHCAHVLKVKVCGAQDALGAVVVLGKRHQHRRLLSHRLHEDARLQVLAAHGGQPRAKDGGAQHTDGLVLDGCRLAVGDRSSHGRHRADHEEQQRQLHPARRRRPTAPGVPPVQQPDPRSPGRSARREDFADTNPESSFCSPTKQPTPQAEGGAWPLLSRDGCSRMWAEARRALPRLTTRRPFLGGGVGWEAAAGGRASTPEVRRQGLVAHRKIYLRAMCTPDIRIRIRLRGCVGGSKMTLLGFVMR